MTEPKIVQIIPAAGDWAVKYHRRDDGGGYQVRVACWALRDDGSVTALVPDDDGAELGPPAHEPDHLVMLGPAGLNQRVRFVFGDGDPPGDSDSELVACGVLSDEDGTRWSAWREAFRLD